MTKTELSSKRILSLLLKKKNQRLKISQQINSIAKFLKFKHSKNKINQATPQTNNLEDTIRMSYKVVASKHQTTTSGILCT